MQKQNDIDFKELNNLLVGLQTMEIYFEELGYPSDSAIVQILRESYNKLYKLDNARICIENEIMKSKGNLTRSYALEYALEEVRKVIK